MKILEVKFKNIHSLEGEHCIDFQDKQFAQSNIFAITGATGSGKSTILDAIVLALYNQMPRMPKISSSEIQKSGAVITRGKRDAYTQVKYECEKGIFTSQWTIRVKRTGVVDNVQMQLYNEQGIPLFQNKQDIPKANSQNIGLTYEQFVKSILLAQGDFALFLKVSKKERSTLLEQITGTEIYRILGKQVFEKNKEIRQQIKSLEDYKETISQKILQDEVWKKYNTQLIDNEVEIEKIKQKNQSLQKQWENLQKQNELIQKLAEFDKKITENTLQQQLFLQNEGEKLEAHLKTEAFADELLLWKKYSEELSINQQDIQEKDKEEERLSQQKNLFLQEVEHFIGKPCSSVDFQEKLMAFQEEILRLENEKNQKLSQYRELSSQVNFELKIIGYQQIDLNKIKNLQSDLLQKQHEIQVSQKAIELQFTQLQIPQISTEIERLKLTAKQLQNAERLSVEIQQKQNDFNEKQTEKQTTEELLQTLPNMLKFSQLEVELSSQKLKTLRAEKQKNELSKSLEAYRHQLIDGEPCPLCGAEHHPYSVGYELVIDDFLSKIDVEEKHLQQLQKNVTIHENSLQNAKEKHAKLIDYLLKISQWISEKNVIFKQHFPQFSVGENWIEKIKENDKKIELLEKYLHEEIILQSITKLHPLLDQLSAIIDEGKRLKELLFSKIGDNDVTRYVGNFQQKWSHLQTEITTNNQHVQHLKKQINKLQEELQLLENELENAISMHGFENISQAVTKRLPFIEVQQLTERKQFLLRENQLLTGQKAAIEENYNQLKKMVNVSVSQEELSEEIQKTNTQLSDLEQYTIDLKLLLKNDKQHREELEQCQQKITETNEKNHVWRLLDVLIGDATGAKFNQFAQDLTLQQLIQLANRRLIKLSPRYLLSQPADNEDDSLIAIDKDMGGERRSVKTLSGGETFILSLSLALALSDLASNNVKIKSLFIDEGFGTLDAETLDQTLDTLERLQQESDKMIGIISHVESLKERITTQIRVKQKGSGFSSIEIISK